MEFQFKVGDKVRNILRHPERSDNERFRFRGVVVACFRNLDKQPRYVVEDSRGHLRIYSYFLEADPD